MTDREIMQQALEDICGARLCEVNSMSSRGEARRLLSKAADALRERLAQLEQEPVIDERIKSVRHMRDVQGYDGNWNYDPYMQGLYNGIEFALSLLEVREPQFKDAPETWLSDINVKRDKFGTEAAHGIKGEA